MGGLCGGGEETTKNQPASGGTDGSKGSTSAAGSANNSKAPSTNNSALSAGTRKQDSGAPAGRGPSAHLVRGGGGESQAGKRAKCPHCNQWVAVGELADHTHHCPERKVSCQHGWCVTVVRQKELQEHMVECAKSRQTRCAKCGDLVPALEVGNHRAKCVTVSCQHCGEEVIPRLIKYCPQQLFRNLVHTKGPFATNYLRQRFFFGRHDSPGQHQSPSSPTAPSTFGSVFGPSDFEPGDIPAAASATITLEQFNAIPDAETRARTINFNVARVQHLWRWARARVAIEDVLFRLIYKEQDNKKESFSVFARTKDRYFDYDESGGQSRLRLMNTPTAAPTMAEGPQKGHYFPASAKDPITPEVCDKVVRDLSSGVKIPYYAVFRVFNEAAEVLKKFPNVQMVPTLEGARYVNGRWVQGGRANVVGDLHGQLQDLLYILQQNGLPHEGNMYVFNGDFVDRGPRGFEVFFLLCMLLLSYPNCVFLARGNHEVSYMNEEYGFDVEVQTKYDRNVFKLIQRCFNALPLATLVGKTVFVVHAGPPRMPDVTIAEINLIDRFRDIPLPEFDQNEEDEIFQDLLWSDPMEKKGWVNSERGVGVLYGPDISAAFMETNGLSLIIRSHETFMRGYEEHHGGRVVTVFSCSNYDGPETNYGSFINLVGGSEQPSFHTYSVMPDDFITADGSAAASAAASALPLPGAAGGAGADLLAIADEDLLMTRTLTTNIVGNEKTGLLGGVFWFTGLLHNRHKSTREDVLRSMRESIFERRHKLLAYFSKIDRTRRGTVWKMEWTEALRNVLNLEVPWFFLRQYLCDTEPGSPRINYVAFLKRFRTAISKCYVDDWVINAVSELHSLTKLRKNADSVRSLLSQPFINYNSFCSIFKKIDYNLSDNALYELFVDFDVDNRGIISGAEYLQFLEGAAADVERRRNRAAAIAARGGAGGVRGRLSVGGGGASDDMMDDEDDDGSLVDDKPEIAWDLDSMNELERVIYTSRNSMHTIFRLPQNNSPLTHDDFTQGIKNLIRAVKKLNAINNENIEAMWDWLARENHRDSLTLEELFLCFLVRDFVLLEKRLSWLGAQNVLNVSDKEVSPFFTMSWLVAPQQQQQQSSGADASPATPPSNSAANTPSLGPAATPARPANGGAAAVAASQDGAVHPGHHSRNSSNNSRRSTGGGSGRAASA